MLISRKGNLVTLINVFETEPHQQQALVEQWMRLAEEEKNEPGFIGAALHRSTDGTRVVNYAQWRSQADLDRFVSRYTEQFATLTPFASRVDPHSYEVVSLYEEASS